MRAVLERTRQAAGKELQQRSESAAAQEQNLPVKRSILNGVRSSRVSELAGIEPKCCEPWLMISKINWGLPLSQLATVVEGKV